MPAAGFRHLRTSMTVFVNFSRWANFFERGKKVSTFLGKEFPPPRGRKKTLVSDWGAEITKIFGTVLGRESICFQVNPLNDALRQHIPNFITAH